MLYDLNLTYIQHLEITHTYSLNSYFLLADILYEIIIYIFFTVYQSQSVTINQLLCKLLLILFSFLTYSSTSSVSIMKRLK